MRMTYKNVNSSLPTKSAVIIFPGRFFDDYDNRYRNRTKILPVYVFLTQLPSCKVRKKEYLISNAFFSFD